MLIYVTSQKGLRQATIGQVFIYLFPLPPTTFFFLFLFFPINFFFCIETRRIVNVVIMFAPGDGSSALAGLNGKDTPEKNKKKENKEKTGSLYNNSVLHLLSPYASPVQHFPFVFFVLSFIVRGRRQLGRKNKNKNKKPSEKRPAADALEL